MLITPEGLVEDLSPWGWQKELPVWDWKGQEGKPLQVRVFTKSPQVKLELNGKLVSEKTMAERDEYIAVFEVPYQSGELTAISLTLIIKLNMIFQIACFGN